MRLFNIFGRRCLPLLSLFLLLLAVPASAQFDGSPYGDGSISYDYHLLPFGGFDGTFLADGPIWNGDFTFPDGQISGCGGVFSVSLGDTAIAIAVGLIDNQDGTYDASLVQVVFPDGAAPGSYPVDITDFTAIFGYAYSVENLSLPAPGQDPVEWLGTLQAANKFGSTSGTIEVTSVGPEGFSGTFSGSMIDPDQFMILSVTGGQFQVNEAIMSPVPPAPAPALLFAAPNPFNPRTELKLTLEHSGPVTVAVFDLKGRRVALLHDGSLAEGSHRWTWNGLSDVGVPQAGGVYFCRARGDGWTLSRKLMLVP